VLVRPQGLRPRARAPLALSCYATEFALNKNFGSSQAKASAKNFPGGERPTKKKRKLAKTTEK